MKKKIQKVVYETTYVCGKPLEEFIAELQAVQTNPEATYEVEVSTDIRIGADEYPYLRVIENTEAK